MYCTHGTLCSLADVSRKIAFQLLANCFPASVDMTLSTSEISVVHTLRI